MSGFFDAETKDDWEPPTASPREVANAESKTEPTSQQPWWNRRSAPPVPRVVLPRRDRGAESNPSTLADSENPVRTKGMPKLPAVEWTVPESPSSIAKTAEGLAAPSLTIPDKPQAPASRPSELVLSGSNPASGPGVIQPPSRQVSNSRNGSAAKEPCLETGVEEVDLEASLRSLPPDFREVVQRTLQAVQAGKSIEEATMAPPPSVTSTTTANSGPGPANGAVKARLSESTLDATPPLPPAQVAVATPQPQNQEPVIRTSAQSTPDLPRPSPPRTGTWHSTISEAIELLEKELESNPSADESLRRSQEITLRMLYVSQRRLDDALRPIERMDANEQEFVRHQMQALYEASNPDANPSRPRHWSTVMMSQREATAHLSAVSNLEVRSVAFCTQVDGYGTFQKFVKNQFNADQDVLLYCEIDNVAAEKVKTGFETQLQGSYEIRDSQGRLVADQELPMEPEICSNHRRDYFMVYRIYMPSQIPPGNYELRLTIQDKKGAKYGHSNASFEIRR